MFARSAIILLEVNGFGWNLGNCEYIVWSWPWQISGAIHAEARAGELEEVFFLSGKHRTTLPISSQPNCTKFAHKTWFCDVVNPFRNFFWKFALKGSFFQKTLIIVNDFRLQAAISRKWLQIMNKSWTFLFLEATVSALIEPCTSCSRTYVLLSFCAGWLWAIDWLIDWNLGKWWQVGVPVECWLSIRTVGINSKSFAWPAGYVQERTFLDIGGSSV